LGRCGAEHIGRHGERRYGFGKRGKQHPSHPLERIKGGIDADDVRDRRQLCDAQREGGPRRMPDECGGANALSLHKRDDVVGHWINATATLSA